MKEERRKHRRAADVFMVTYRLKSPFEVTVRTEEQDYAAVAMDIGEGGVGVNVDREISVGAQVRLQFRMFNEISASEKNRQRAFDLDGESRHCRIVGEKNYHVGILFKNASPEDRAFIASYVKDQALKKYFQSRS